MKAYFLVVNKKTRKPVSLFLFEENAKLWINTNSDPYNPFQEYEMVKINLSEDLGDFKKVWIAYTSKDKRVFISHSKDKLLAVITSTNDIFDDNDDYFFDQIFVY